MTIEGSLEVLARDVDSSEHGPFVQKLKKCQTLKFKPAELQTLMKVITFLLYIVDSISPMIIFSTGTSLPQRWMLLFTQGLTGVFRQADETFSTHSTHTRR
jgi:hypothetical protein